MANIADLANRIDSVSKDLDTIADCIQKQDFYIHNGEYRISKDVTVGDMFKIGKVSADAPTKIESFQLAPNKIDQIKQTIVKDVKQK